MKIFTKKEKAPIVTKFKGRETIFITGFRKLNINDKTKPARTNVEKPPVTLTPGKKRVKKYKESPLIKALRSIDFIFSVPIWYHVRYEKAKF